MAVSLVIFAGSIYLASKLKIEEFKNKLKYTSRIFFVLTIVITLSSYYVNLRNVSGDSAGTNRIKNVIVFVVDGFPANFFKEYSDDGHLSIKETGLDAMVFKNINTNYTYTYGYFKAFYTGSKSGEKKANNILRSLNMEDINTSWLTFHTNGMPDVHGIKNYDGLRSFLCVPEMTRFLDFFSMNYNIYTNPRMRDSLTQYYTYELLKRFIKAEEFDDMIVGQVERLNGYGKPFLFIIHSYLDYIDTPANPVIKLWEKNSVRDGEAIAISKIHDNDNRYEPGEAGIADKMRMKIIKKSYNQINIFKNIINGLRQKNMMDNTVIVFTADHGVIFSRGKLFYGFHYDDEVAKVPFVILNYGKRDTVDILGETIDIPRTLQDILEVKNISKNNSVSLLGTEKKILTTSVTDYSKKRNELFLNVYFKDGSITVNVPSFIAGKPYVVKSNTRYFKGDMGKRVFYFIKDVIDDYKIKL